MATRVIDKHDRVIANDSKYTGEEPQWDGCETWDPIKFMSNRNRLFGFYNYYLSAKDLKPFALKWMKNNSYSADDIKYVKSLNDTTPSVTASKLCRALDKGMSPTCDNCMEYYKDKAGYADAAPHNDYDFVKLEIDGILLAKRVDSTPIKDDVKVVPHKNNVSPVERLKNKVESTVCRDLDWMLDDWVTDDVKVYGINLHSSLKANNIPVLGVKYVESWLTRFRNELQGSIDKDPDCVEGYSYLSRAGIRHRLKELDKMLSQLEKYRATNTAARKPRTKKVRAADKQVQSLKYLNESEDYAITSTSPVNIPGSKVVYTFNIKYRKLTAYISNSTDGIFVKGSTLSNFDEKLSYSMTIRKPDDVLKLIVTKTEKQIEKAIGLINGKRKPANGRTNENTLLLKTL